MSKDGGNNDLYYEVGTSLSVMRVESPLVVGGTYGGGKVAYILQSGDPGYVEGVQKGFITTLTMQSNAAYGCYNTSMAGADGTAIGTGYQNTLDAVAGCATAGTAAKVARAVTDGGYTDWYLPSKDELNKLYLNRVAIGGFPSGTLFTWSSSESDSIGAWRHSFYDGTQDSLYNKSAGGYVRAIRSF